MPKYIRTKDNIYEVDEKEMIACPNDDGTTDIYYKLKSNKVVNRNDIIDESDKLEDLCDEFVNVITPKDAEPYGNLTWYDEFISLHQRYPENKFYGAIWTTGSKDELILKSVAKMNDNGELELL